MSIIYHKHNKKASVFGVNEYNPQTLAKSMLMTLFTFIHETTLRYYSAFLGRILFVQNKNRAGMFFSLPDPTVPVSDYSVTVPVFIQSLNFFSTASYVLEEISGSLSPHVSSAFL